MPASASYIFITETARQKTIGLIELISLQTAKKHYRLDHYPFFIEFCLSSNYRGMGNLLNQLLLEFATQSIYPIAAVIRPENRDAIRVLQYIGMNYQGPLDNLQQFYTNQISTRA